MLLFESKTLLNFLVVDDPQGDVIIGSPTLEKMQAYIDMGNHTVTVTIEEKHCILGLKYDKGIPHMEGCINGGEDFTSDSEIHPASSSLEIDDDKERVVVLAKEIESCPTVDGDSDGEETILHLFKEDEGGDLENAELHVLSLFEKKKT